MIESNSPSGMPFLPALRGGAAYSLLALAALTACSNGKQGAGSGDAGSADGGPINGGGVDDAGIPFLAENAANVPSTQRYFSKPIRASSDVTLHHVRAKSIQLLTLPHAVVSVSLDSAFSFSADGVVWQDRLSETAFEGRVTVHKDRVVRYGMPFAIESSSDGVAWERQPIAASSLRPVASLSNRLSGVDPRSGLIWQQSLDGQWTAHERPKLGKAINAMTAQGEVMLAVGDDGLAVTSVAGGVWADVSLDVTADFTAVVPHKGRFIGLLSDGRVYALGEGTGWQKVFENPDIALTSIVSSASALFAMGRNTDSEQAAVFSTEDLVKWQASAINGAGSIVSGTSFKSSVYAVDDRGRIFTLADGKTWELARDRARRFKSVKFVGERFVAVGEAGLLAVSADGSTWTEGTHPFKGDLLDVAFAQDRHVVCGAEGLLASFDAGLTWTALPSPLSNVDSITFGSGKWMAVQADEKIVSSPDLVTWTLQSSPRAASGSAATRGTWGASYWNGKWCVRKDTEGPVWCSQNLSVWSPLTYDTANASSPIGQRKLVTNGARISLMGVTHSPGISMPGSSPPALVHHSWPGEIVSLKLLAFSEQRLSTGSTAIWAATARKAFRFEDGPSLASVVKDRRVLGEIPMVLTDMAASPDRLVIVGDGEMIASLATEVQAQP